MQDPLDRLAEEFAERCRRGENPTIEEYAERHPGLAVQIRELFAAIRFMEKHGSVEEEPPGLAAGTGAEVIDGLPTIGDYRLIRTIGRGGMGVVYEAEQLSLQRRVALKVLPAHSRINPSQLRRFELEARLAAQLQHPGIVPVFEVDEVDGFHFYAMQFIPGRGLDEVIEELRGWKSISPESRPDLSNSVAGSILEGRLEVEKREGAGATSPAVQLPGQSSPSASHASTPYFRSVALIGVQVSRALAYAHERGILHRDVKPSNLLLDMKGNVWVTDFGLAKAEGSEALTRTGDFVGTLRYMGPERFDGWSDPTSDVYSLGATLYELLTLRPAFDRADRASLVRQIVHHAPPPPRSLDPRIPRDLETIVLKAMKKEPRLRYQSAGQLAADLERFLEGRPIVARRSSAVERSWLWCRRNPWVATLAASIAALLVAVAIGASIMAYDSRQKLRLASLEQARAMRWSGQVGQRYGSLRAIEEAARIRPGLDLRNQAIAALALIDLDHAGEWALPDPGVVKDRNLELDGKHERLFHGTRVGTIDVYPVGERQPAYRLEGSAGAITGLRVDPAGRFIAAVHELEIAVWDLDGRQALWRREKPRSVWAGDVDFSNDSSRIATGDRRGNVSVLETLSGREVRRFSTGLDVIQTRFSPDGRTLAVCGFGPDTAQLWDIEGAVKRRSLEHEREVYAVGWSPRGDVFATGSSDAHIDLWDPSSGRRLRRLEGHDGPVVHLAFHPAGDLLASSGWDGLTCLWDPHSSRPFPLLRHEGICTTFSECGRFLAFHSLTSGETFEVAPRDVYRPLHGHTGDGAPFGAAFSPDGRWLATIGHGDGIRLRELTTFREAAHLPAEGIRTIFFRAGGTIFFRAGGTSFLAGGDHGLHLWPFREERGEAGTRLVIGPPEALRKGVRIRAFDLAAETDTVAAIHDGNHIQVFAVSTPSVSVRHDGHAGLASCAISPDGLWIAGGTHHGAGVPIWRAGKEKKERVLPISWTATVAFSPDSRWLVTSDGEEYRFWSTRTWEPGIRLERHRAGDSAGAMQFSPDGRILATTWTRKVIRLVDPGSGAELATLEAPHGYHIGWIAFNRDATRLAATTPNHLVHLWDLRTLGERLAALGLDWELTALPPAPEARGAPPLEVSVDLGDLDPELRAPREEIDRATARIRKDPADHEAYLGRAWQHHKIGENRKAVEDLDEVLELSPDNLRARDLRSLALEALGEWEEAIAERERILAGRPDDPLEMNDLAWLYVAAPERHRRPERALELASRAVEKDPHKNISLNTLGVAHYRLGQFEKAGDVLRRALFAEGGATAFDEIFLAMTAAKLGDREAARRHHEASLRLLAEATGRKALTPGQRREMERFQAEARELLGLE